MASSSDLSLRPVTDDDASFLFDLFRETHESEYEDLSLPIDQLDAILQMQFQAQQSDYTFRHPEAAHEIIEVRGSAVGQWAWTEKSDHITYIDISISKKFRNQGIASQVTRKLLKRSAQKGLPVYGHVARNNPKAIILWHRLGFRTVGQNQMHLAIEFTPDNPPDSTPSES
jgi:ribosomal protein S18 acetylase RimI-like enzyme